ncbi:Glycogenin-1 [Orchesella cincta]|uniref:glycogenin glucosyltransferase n=1 Tax=Orchesella cincta TaxID=48709 RepID=A0A1D2NJG5_ORCCI|nr:Glycogenin-1 [Orchesella cincta]
MQSAQAWVTLATNDSYALGALVLARSLRRVNTTRQLAVMVTPGISDAMRGILSDVFDVVNEVNILDSEDTAHLALLERPELGITFTKIHCWKLTQFSKCVFLDADTLVFQNCDELFNREEISAAPDAGWPDCFNSGVFVFTPSLETHRHITDFALQNGSFDGGDQGLLNMYFRDWSQSDASHRLPFIYNMVASASYSYLPAYKVFGQNVKIVHFIGQEKPWLTFFDTTTGLARPPSGQEHLQELLQAWWNIFRSEVHPRLSPEMKGIAGVYAKTAMEGEKSGGQLEYEDSMRKTAWEQGHIDYMGKDSFDNIMKKIQASMAQTSVPRPPPKSPTPQRKQSPPKQEAPPTAAPEVPPPAEAVPVVVRQSEATPVVPPQAEAAPAEAVPVVVPQTETVPVVPPQTETVPVVPPKAKTVPPVTTKTPPTPPVVVEEVPVVEPIIVKTQAVRKQAPPVPADPSPETSAAAEKTREEDRVALEERQAVEKKLAEQKIAAEQKLEEEKQAAAARAASAAAAASSSAAKPKPQPEVPRAPVRKENAGLGNTMQVGLGILGAAVVLVFAIYAAYSPTAR